MRLATVIDGTPDGRLVVVSADGAHCAPAPVKTLQEALEGVTNGQVEIAKEVLQKVYENLK